MSGILWRPWRWSAQVDFSSAAAARGMPEATDALADPFEAERAGLHLLLPDDLLT